MRPVFTPWSHRFRPSHRLCKFRSQLCALGLLAAVSSAPAAIVYWDTNGSTPGAGNPANGTWDATSALWSLDPTGSAETSAYVANSDVVFSAGSDAATASVNLVGNQNANSVLIKNGSVTFTGAVLQVATNGSFTVDSGASATFTTSTLRTGNPASLVINGYLSASNLTGGGVITKTGSGTASFGTLDANATVNAGMVIVNGGNKTKGVTVANGAVFRLAGNDAILNTANVSVASGGRFELEAGVSDTINQLSGAGTVDGGTGAVLTVGNTAATSSFSGSITGALSLVKIGTGTQTLGGINTYSGNTTVSGGALTLADGGSFTFYIGAAGVNNKIDGTGIVNLDGDFVFDLTNAAADGAWQIVDVSTLTETFGSTFSVTGWMDVGGNLWQYTTGGGVVYSFDESTGVLSAVPEPSTYLLVASGLALVLWRNRRNRK